MLIKFAKIKASIYYPVTARHANYQAICKELLEIFSSFFFITDIPVRWENSQMATREYPQLIVNDKGIHNGHRYE